MKKILLSLSIIALVVAGVAGATVAYFSDGETVGGNTFTMGTVELEEASISGLPYTFEDMIPGEQVESDVIKVRNKGSMPVDLYVGLQDDTPWNDGRDAWGDNPGFIGVVDFAINEVDCSNGDYITRRSGWGDIGRLFTNWAQIGEDIPANGLSCYKMYVEPDADMGNDYQGMNAQNDVILYAVQTGYGVPDSSPENWSE